MIIMIHLLLATALMLPSAVAPIDLPVGTRLSIRLRDSISSKYSQPGNVVTATLIAPVLTGGKEVIPSGFLVQGTVANPSPAHKRLNHSVLCLRFGKLIGKGNNS